MKKGTTAKRRSIHKPASPPPELVELANDLGDPALDYVILGEGNVSSHASNGTFWVKASGVNLLGARADGFVRVAAASILATVNGQEKSDEHVRQALVDCRADGRDGPLPSVETFMHGVLLAVPGVNYVGHTHPTAINMVTCSTKFQEALGGRLFPDETVLCGPASVLVPYVDPGLALAREIQNRVHAFIEHHGERPRAIYLQNHGFIALGSSPNEVRNITAMAVKAARILVGTFHLGGPRFMPDADVRRIHGRLDEEYRKRIIENGK